MEAGKERLTRDTVRDATRQEIEHLKRENNDLLVAALEVHRFKKTDPDLRRKSGHERPREVGSPNTGRRDPWGKRRLLAQLRVPKSTYYRWRALERQGKQECLARVLEQA